MVVALLGAACDKAQLLAPTSSTITITAPVRTLPLGGSTEISAVVVEQAGTPVPNGTTVRFSSSLGTLSPIEAQTQNGVATTTFTAGNASGTAEIRAISGAATGGEGETAANTVSIAIGAAALDDNGLTLATSSGSVPATGGTVTLTAMAVDESNQPIANVSITFTTTEGTLSASRVVTDANGEAQTTLTTDRDATVTARVGSVASNEVTITRRTPAPTPSVSLTAAGGTATAAGQLWTFTATVAGTGTEENEIFPVRYEWDFGDGTTATTNGNTTAHVYTAFGQVRSVTVVVTMTDGRDISASTQILIADAPTP